MKYRRQKSFFQTTRGLLTVLFGVICLFFLYKYSTGNNEVNINGRGGAGNTCNGPDCPCDDGPIEIISWSPRVFKWHSFLTEEECDYMIKYGEPKLQRSKVVGAEKEEVSDVRTSSGAFLPPDNDPVIMEIERRLAEWTMIPVEHGESFYLLKYGLGQQYLPHFDYFSGEGMERHVGASGQRTVTVLLYLSTPEEGGETIFPKANLNVSAKKGDAVLFHSHLPNGELDEMSLHGGNPVIKGTKYCMTKWLRVRPYEYSWYVANDVKPLEKTFEGAQPL